MLRLTLAERRRRYLRETLDIGEPSRLVREVLAVQGDAVLIPIRHALAMSQWMGRAHAYFGIGYPTTLIEMRAKMANWLHELDGHPAMWGHGMLGQPRSLPISCWRIDGARYPDRLYALHPVGTEGYLVPTKERVGGHRGIVTAWTFEPVPHGPPRPATTMFRSSFGTRQEVDIDPAAQDAATAHVRAQILGQRLEEDPLEWALEEDGGDVPQAP